MNRTQGFSLIEVLIVVSVAVTLVFVVSNLGNNVNGLNNLISQELQTKSDISQTLQIITTEIRSAGTAQNGAYPIDVAGTSTFSFYSDINKDGATEHIRYYFASSSIYKGVIQATGTPATYPTSSEIVTDIIDSVTLTTSTPLFSYFDSAYTGTQSALTQPVDVSKVRVVQMTFNADTQQSQAPGPQYFTTVVDIRNLRSN